MAGPAQFERYTERARQVLVVADEVARSLNHNYYGTEHLLLGVVRNEGVAAAVLAGAGVTAPEVREAIVHFIGRGDEGAEGALPFSPRARRALDRAPDLADLLGAKAVGPEHILLALLSEREGVAAAILRQHGVDSAAVSEQLLRLLDRDAPDAKTSAITDDEPSVADAAAVVGLEFADPSGLERVPTHADRPATADALGRGRLAEVLAERMRRVRGEDTEHEAGTRRARRRKLRADRRAAARAGSFMIHVHAPWGAGKSSFLNFLAVELRNLRRPWPLLDGLRMRAPRDEGASQWIVAQFSAWEHQRLTPPWWWLLTALRRSCGRELWRIHRGRWTWFHARDLAWRAWNARTAWIAALLVAACVAVAAASDWFGLQDRSFAALGATALAGSAVLALAATVWGRVAGTSRWLAFGSADGAARFLRRAHDPLGVYRRRFRWLVRSAGRPIAVFIDDLDRCKPEYVVELLEGIQTLFTDEPVTYVVAADRTWLCESFTAGYQAFDAVVGEPGRPMGFLFLEKTFQVSMEIPPMSYAERDDYWRGLMHAARSISVSVSDRARPDFSGAGTEQQIEERIEQLVSTGHDEDAVLRAAVRKLNAPMLESQLERLLSVYAPLVENNPRSMKRLLNAYGIERDRLIRERRSPSVAERRELILLTILRLRWPLLAEHLAKHPEDAGLFGIDEADVPNDHPFAPLIRDRDVRGLFDGVLVDARLDADALRRYSGYSLRQSPSVGA
jgi:hypothetical protein